MHYYTFHPKDYMSKANFLEPMEDLAYRRMLDYQYLNESPLPVDIDEIAMLINMRSHSDSIAVVLRYFFELTEDGYVNDRAEKEIAKYQEKSEKARKSADARWKKKRSKANKDKGSSDSDANALRTDSEGNANQEPLTKNQEPRTTNQKPRTSNQENGSLANSDYAVGESIRDWIPPTLEQINARLVMSAPPVAAITKDQYAEYGRKFKNYFAEQELDGKYLRTESRRIDKLVDWVKREVGAFSKNRSNQSLNTPAPLGSPKVDITKRFAHLKKQGADA